MNNTPRCPYCGDRMDLHILPHTTEHELISAWYQCVVCESTSPRLEFPGDASYDKVEDLMLAAVSHRAESKNRVLTYDELGSHVGLMWFEFIRPDYGGKRIRGLPVYNYGDYNFQTDETPDNPLTKKDIEAGRRKYNKAFRCWLRKPTDEETRSTPWEE